MGCGFDFSLKEPLSMNISKRVVILLLCIATTGTLAGQGLVDSSFKQADKITGKYIRAIDGKAAKVAADIDRQTEKYLNQLEKQEAKLRKKLSRIDSLAALNVFADTKEQYHNIRNKVKERQAQLVGRGGRYFPWIDSAGTSLEFLANKNPLISNAAGNVAKIQGALSKVKELQNQFKQAADVKDFIRQRKEYLQQQLKSYSLGSELKKYNQTAYYYTQQINDYREALNDPEKAERKVLSLLRRIPAFEKFMHDHGELAGLFDIPEDYASNMTGLQTREQVQNMMQSRIQGLGPNAQADVQQSIGAAQSELSKLRNRFLSSGSTEDMPDFKPKDLKTKTFFQRLEYGTNIQTVKSNYFFPTTTDMALSVGYKLGEKNIVGVGASYKMGWGKDISHIAISSEGIGFRSFADFKLKGSLFVSGGLEYNYQPLSATFSSAVGGGRGESWQQSGLLGISKIVSLKTKFFKKTKLQVLWDMLSYQQVPRGQAVKFRVGYSL